MGRLGRNVFKVVDELQTAACQPKSAKCDPVVLTPRNVRPGSLHHESDKLHGTHKTPNLKK